VSSENRLSVGHISIKAQLAPLRVSLSDTNATQPTPSLGPIGDLISNRSRARRRVEKQAFKKVGNSRVDSLPM